MILPLHKKPLITINRRFNLHIIKYLIFGLAISIVTVTGCQHKTLPKTEKKCTPIAACQSKDVIIQPRTDEPLVAYISNGDVDHYALYMVDPIELTGNDPNNLLDADIKDVLHVFSGPVIYTGNIFTWPISMLIKELPFATQTSRSIYQANIETQQILPPQAASEITTEDFNNIQHNDLISKY